ncbi:hypothetical protein [Bacillus sp. CGMCC 1.16541]|uniref:hypothetical protein n=1 Tax=Bacillus sp. CGMCC 1.16541 TaxID=2185143 RepID=UPI000D7386E3|nr:hypothetical protein [Bacillus sp. CGMCC 1.16541]
MNIIEYVINFLLSNMFIVVIIGGLILNVYQRFVEQSKERNKAPERPREQKDNKAPQRPFQQPNIDSPKRTMAEKVEEQKRQMETRIDDVKGQKNVQELQEKLASLKAKAAQAKARKEAVEQTSSQNMATRTMVNSPKRTSRKNVGRLSINGKKAVEGVIWSEILGPPKSKRQIYKR